MVFIRFLLNKSYENCFFFWPKIMKIVIRKKQCIYNQVLMCFLNMCEKSKICIFLKQREYLFQ